MADSTDLTSLLHRLGARRTRLESLIGADGVPDTAGMVSQLGILAEELVVADEELRAQDEQLQAIASQVTLLAAQWEQIFAGAPVPYLLTDLQGLITHANVPARRLLGERVDLTTALRPIATKFTRDDRSDVRLAVGRAAAASEPQRIAARLARGGQPVAVTVSTIELGDGAPALWWQLEPEAAPEPSHQREITQVLRPLATLSELIARSAGELANHPAPEEVLRRAVTLALSSVPGAEAVGVAYQRTPGTFEIVDVSGPVARRADELQYSLDEGPCVDAARQRETIYSPDVVHDERWPRLASSIGEIGVRSVLASHLATPQGRVAALNIYSTVPDAFPPSARLVARAFAAHAGIALGAVEQEHTLRQAMATREMIGQAVGILVERLKVTPGRAFAILVHVSQTHNIKLRDIAQRLVETGETPQPRRPGSPRGGS